MLLHRFILWILGVSIALGASYFVLFPQVWYCRWIGFSDFKPLNNRFYVSPQSSPKHQQEAQKAIFEAQKRVQKLWGGRIGQPTIILCETPTEYASYCHSDEGAGCSIGTPWGASYIILNLDGLNVDVIAHEMCHDELFTRLGWWTTTRQIPQWFNEGLALMVDYRFVAASDSIQRYLDYKDECSYISNGGQIVLDLNEISSMRGFFGGDKGRVMLAYMTAGTEVSRWLANAGINNIPILINRIKSGETFTSSYDFLDKKRPTN
jgi:hypothetical protein